MPDQDNELSGQTADLLTLADTERWTTIRTTRTQSVAEHSFGVAVIAIELGVRLGIMDDMHTAQVLSWALMHDAPENLTGDIDGRFKREFPKVAQAIKAAERTLFPWYGRMYDNVPTDVYVLVKTADRIEGIAFIRQWGIGAQADEVYQELRGILHREVVPELVEVFSNLDPVGVARAVDVTLERILAQTHTYRRRNRWTVEPG